MHRIDHCLMDLDRSGKKALCVYLCVGDPSLDESRELALAAIDAGADLLELGVPFSDPTADGPVLARAARRAIEAGSSIERVLDVAHAIRERSDTPLVLFTYYNPVFVRGEVRIANRANDAGIDALLVVDLPPEEAGTLRDVCAGRGLGIVPLVAPTTDAARLDVIRGLSVAPVGAPRAFVYAVSMTGVTGACAADVASMGRSAMMYRQALGKPVLVGFGIDNAENARAAAGERGTGPDGIVVGTAITRRIEQGATRNERVRLVRTFVQELRRALDA
jgi:tryptophan synthase alpha chain